MIIKASATKTNQVLSLEQQLEKSNAKFYPTGSRCFRGAIVTDDTDWDFFVNEAQITEETLTKYGLAVLDNLDYSDDPTAAKVYRGICPVTGMKYDIQVIPADQFQVKLEAQIIMEKFFNENKVFFLHDTAHAKKRCYCDYTKSERYVLWEMAVMIARGCADRMAEGHMDQ